MGMLAVITDCIILLVSTQQAPLVVILTGITARMPAVIPIRRAAALPMQTNAAAKGHQEVCTMEELVSAYYLDVLVVLFIPYNIRHKPI